MRVLSWNLFHGRADPAAGRPLLTEFARTLASWDWDVALLQEVPPWWPPLLAHACDAEQALRRTSRNEPLAPRRAIARRNPDLVKANGGGCNAILVRGDSIAEHRARRLTWRPERRWAHGVRLRGSGWWLVNLHATTDPKTRTQRDLETAARAALEWAAGTPVVLGGDLNTSRPRLEQPFAIAASSGLDHLAVAGGVQPVGPPERPDAGPLSDHPPLLATLGA